MHGIPYYRMPEVPTKTRQERCKELLIDLQIAEKQDTDQVLIARLRGEIATFPQEIAEEAFNSVADMGLYESSVPAAFKHLPNSRTLKVIDES